MSRQVRQNLWIADLDPDTAYHMHIDGPDRWRYGMRCDVAITEAALLQWLADDGRFGIIWHSRHAKILGICSPSQAAINDLMQMLATDCDLVVECVVGCMAERNPQLRELCSANTEKVYVSDGFRRSDAFCRSDAQVACKSCHGRKHVTPVDPRVRDDGYIETRELPCPRCGGTGWEPHDNS